jgi:glycosyltransferase involved in cell wall biosynthesis
MTQVDVTLVVCTYNRAALLRDALRSLAVLDTEDRFTYEVLVVDNGSTDDTAGVFDEVARQCQVPIRRVLEPRQGVSYARNRGVADARGTWLAFFDDDQLADPRWLLELLATAEKCQARCVGGSRKLRLPDGCQRRLHSYCRGLLGEHAPGGPPRLYERKEAPTTGNLLVHRSIFDQVGMFHESLHAGGEDSHLYCSIREANVEGWYHPQALVHHIIPPYRLTDSYLKWTARRHGWNKAWRDRQVGGRLKLAAMSIGRLTQAVCLHMPKLVSSKLLRDKERSLGIECRLSGTVGYLRGALHFAIPRLFTQSAFFDHLAFRGEREAFANGSSTR